MSVWRRHLTAVVAVLVAVFVAFYPYLNPAGYCGPDGCPEVSQASAPAMPDSPAGGALAVLTTAATVAALSAASLLRAPPDQSPEQVHLSPETPPPRG